MVKTKLRKFNSNGPRGNERSNPLKIMWIKNTTKNLTHILFVLTIKRYLKYPLALNHKIAFSIDFFVETISKSISVMAL